MDLKTLKQLESDAQDADRYADWRKNAIEKLAKTRQSEDNFLDIYNELTRYESTGLIKASVNKALAFLRDDILRLAEMTLEAERRGYLAKSFAAKQMIKSYLADEPDART